MNNTEHPNVEPWQLGFQEPVTPVMQQINELHDGLTITITIISIFVLALLIYVMWNFREKKNPNPSKVTHNTPLEIAWTVIPILILVAISIPSLRLHYYMDKAEEPDMAIKVAGYQWYWNYEYPDHGDISFDSYMIKDEDLKKDQVRLLSVDNPIVVPVNKTVAVYTTGGDVIHSWAMPAFGVKKDAIPGRLNETWFRAEKEGVYYGQCSEICGVGHGFMPIEVHVVSEQAFDAWVEGSKAALAGSGSYNSREILAKAQDELLLDQPELVALKTTINE
jgi:cytochrome c oxidase subunit 2